MEVNTLVKHKDLSSLGIGCVSKELKRSCRVNFGPNDCWTVSKRLLEPIDVSKCKTISFQRYKRRILNVVNLDINKVIVGNEIHEFVGIGWIILGTITEDDLLMYPRVIE